MGNGNSLYDELYLAACRVLNNIPKPLKVPVARDSWEDLEKAFNKLKEERSREDGGKI